MNDFVVPVTAAIQDFARHIEANPRTILSSRFGDGKSFFLQKVKEDVDINDEYEFLTIYPVNYQVVGNKDIYELIKRDILFQLMLHGMISNSVVLKESEAFSWFVRMNAKSLIADLIPYISELGLEPDESAKVLTAMKGLKLFKSINTQYEKFKKDQLQTDDERIDAFLKRTDAHFIYECDVITLIIQKAIKDFQRRTHKKVVLIVEDLDRLDPAHLFRILNVLSAHIDYSYKCFVKPDASLIGNKFCLDNIVLVIDYNNLKHIYKHFYGERTDFNGYISKFLSSVPFLYSLEKQKYDYIVDKLVDITNLNVATIKYLFPKSILLSKTMREIVQSFDISNSILGKPNIKIKGRKVNLNTSFLKVIVILRRLKYTDDEIKQTILSLKDKKQDLFVNYVLPFAFLSNKNLGDNELLLNMNNEKNQARTIKLTLDGNTGKATVSEYYMRMGNEVENNFEECVNYMLDYIV